MADIRAFIAQQDVASADRFAHLERIAKLGHSGVPRDKVRPGLRLAVHGRYNIYFRVTRTETVIVRVVHSARDVRRLSFHDRH